MEPLFNDFDNAGCTFLGTTFAFGKAFDLYIADTNIDDLKEIIAVMESHSEGGPLAMESTMCEHYDENHPLRAGFELAKLRNLLY